MKSYKASFLRLSIVLTLFFVLALPEFDKLYAVELIAPSDYAKDTLSVGSEYYLDRTYEIGSQPAGFENHTAILTRNDDKYVSDSEHIILNLSSSATIYVAYDKRASSLPTWLESFTSTGDRVYSNGDSSMGYFRLYKKDYPPGQVVLGGNHCGGDTGARSNYIVYVAQTTTLEVDPTSLNLAPGDTSTATISGGTSPYTVSSSNPSAATATVSGDTVTVSGIADGSTTITISDSASSSVIISVMVATALVVNPESLEIPAGGVGTATISGGTSPYTVSSSNPSAATATVSDDTVTVSGVSYGTTTITITDDVDNSVTISVTVTSPLAADPTVVDLDPGDTATVTISGGSGSYSVTSGNTSVATASMSGSTVTITAVAAGNISVTITDSASNVVTVSVNVGGATAESKLGECPMPPFVCRKDLAPNVLLILDHSGSMGSGTPSNWDTAKTVLKNLIDDFSNVRFGLMRMDGSDYSGNDWGTGSGWPYTHSGSPVVRQGGKILKPCGTPGDEIKTYITNWGDESNKPQTWTNLAETLASAGRYFATVIEGGNRVGKGPEQFGYYEKNYHYDIGGTTYDATTTDDKGNTIDTTSPIQYWCHKSFVIFITDGLANYDNDWDIVTDVIGDYDDDGDSEDCKYGDAGCSSQGKYFDDVAKYLYEHDMRSDFPEAQNNITTYVIGFHIDDPLLSSAAKNGGGQYYTADNASGLAAALQSAIENILDKISSGTAVTTISTSCESADYLIRAKFLPKSQKGYLEAFTMPYDDDNTPVWEAGKLLSETSSSSRHIYTYMNSQKQNFASTNSALKTYLKGEWEVTESEASDIINYLRGDSTHEGGKYRDRDDWPLGDIIYSKPVVVGAPKFYYGENNYQTFKDNNSIRTTMVYVGANDGMLHAFMASDGSEQWAFIPENIQANLKGLTEEDCHKYYVDLSPLVTDIWDGTGWKTVLIGGNRFGGEEYFCLDVTDPAFGSFSILWDTIPFSDKKSSTIPVVGKVRGGGVDKWVAIITSGYHEGTSEGKIAALNATNGTKETIWNDGTSNVNELSTHAKGGSNSYYTLSSPAGVDSDDDGYLDLIYAGDTEGSLWKFYYDYENNIWKKVELFQTGGQPITAKPVLAFDKESKLRIYFGTGKYLVGIDKYNSTRNALYCLIENKVDTEDDNNGHFTSTSTISKTDDLVELTSVKTQEDFDNLSTANQTKVDNNGWYFQLDAPTGPAERVLEQGTVISGVLFFTSFTPNSDVCGYGGTSRLYAIDYERGLIGMTGGETVLENPEEDERYKDLGPGLPSKPVFYFDLNTRKTKLIIQTSDTEVHEETVNVEGRPMAITSWRSY